MSSSNQKLLLAGGLFLMLIVGIVMLFTFVAGVGIFMVVSGPDETAETTPRRVWAAAPQVATATPSAQEATTHEETAGVVQVPQSAADGAITEPVASSALENVITAGEDVVEPQTETVVQEASAAVSDPANTSSQASRPVQASPTPQAQAAAPMTTAAVASTATASPTPSPTTVSNGTATATPKATTTTSTPASTGTATPGLGQMSGRLLLNGAPVSQGVTLFLEDSAANPIAEASITAGGQYTFDALSPSEEGYTVVFAQESNAQFDIDQVISWGWLGPVPVQNEAVINLPDFDIALQGFGQTSPAPNASFSAAALAAEPITFEWSGYPQANDYWLDLAEEKTEQIIWQATVDGGTSLSFDGRIDGGGSIQPGEYWWGVGARRQLGNYPLIVYGYLPVLQIEP